jgi:HK97 family phage prohead protease
MLTKTLELGHCGLKFASDAGEFEGYASVFNSNDAVGDTILPGAFQKSLDEGRTPAMFINHDHRGIPVGRWIEMYEDSHGLVAKGVIDVSHSQGKDLYPAMKDGRMSGLSIGFGMNQKDYDRKDEGGRLIKNVDLREVSVVTYPCEDQARISAVKSALLADIQNFRDAENFLRDVGGMTRSEAKTFLSLCKAIHRRDVGREDAESKTIEQATSLLTTLNNLKFRR